VSDIETKHKTEQYLKEFYEGSSSLDIKGFYYISRLHSIIVLEVSLATVDKNHLISFEYLCDHIPRNLGKRTTIQTILNEAVRKNFFTKTTSQKDKRVKYYILEKTSAEVIEKWWAERSPNSLQS
jgi:hypothetical protein|tara:strand:- start:156 stop:530 length:375 start_codon:yes stop_codon:yes gene_type:complete